MPSGETRTAWLALCHAGDDGAALLGEARRFRSAEERSSQSCRSRAWSRARPVDARSLSARWLITASVVCCRTFQEMASPEKWSALSFRSGSGSLGRRCRLLCSSSAAMRQNF